MLFANRRRLRIVNQTMKSAREDLLAALGIDSNDDIAGLAEAAREVMESQDVELTELGQLVETQAESIADLQEEKKLAQQLSKSVGLLVTTDLQCTKFQDLLEIRNQQVDMLEEDSRRLNGFYKTQVKGAQTYKHACQALGLTLGLSFILIFILIASL